jgi:hypothetical protein
MITTRTHTDKNYLEHWVERKRKRKGGKCGKIKEREYKT